MLKPVSASHLFAQTLALPQEKKRGSKIKFTSSARSSLRGLAMDRKLTVGPGAAKVPISVTLRLLGVSQTCARGPGVLLDVDQHVMQDHIAASQAALKLFEELQAAGFDRISMGRQDDTILERLPGGRYHIGPFTEDLVVLGYSEPMGGRRCEVLGIQHVRRRLEDLMR